MFRSLSNHFALFAIALALSISVSAQSGSLDLTFGTGGKRLITETSFGGTTQTDAVIQSDGKVISLVSDSTSRATMIRLNTDGSLDTAFAGDGIVETDWQGGTSLPRGYPFGIAIDAEGRFVVAGSWTVTQGRNSSVEKLRVDRYMTDGSIDTSFGTNGTTLFNLPYANAVAVQPDGQIVIVGGGVVVRLNPNGTLDGSFGTSGSGTVTTGLSYVYSVKPLPDGKILIGGDHSQGSDTLMCVNRLNANGSLDTSFGNGGRAIANFFGKGSYGRAEDVDIDPFGNIVAGGIGRRKGSTESEFAAARFTSSGQPDITFNGTGRATYAFAGQSASAWSAVVQGDGKVIVSGQARNAASGNSVDFTLIRFNYNGTIDTTFGSSGVTRTDIDNNLNDYSRSALIWTDPLCACEKITVAGFSVGGAAFARYLTF